ncbi:MAG TPA: glycosyltransferase N-terminal domain-containing protein [Gammaproteobacteria bacterium]
MDTRRERLLYHMLLWLLWLPLFLYTAWQAFRAREPRYLRHRLGLYERGDNRRPLWLHAASVGEVNAVLPLIESLRKHHPTLPLLVTTTTLSGAATVRNKLPAGIRHAWLPLDYPAAVRRFLDAHIPRCAVIMETELWPHLYARCRSRAIPLLLVNGRLSSRTLRAPQWLRRLYGYTLRQVTTILARAESDRMGFIALGADAARCSVVGNIKFAAAPRADKLSAIDLGRRYILAASTRDGEERLILDAWEKSGIDHCLLVIAPRHPQRLSAILKEVGERPVAIRSRSEAVTAKTSIYIADTFGELPALMLGAELVFMGGSLVPKGGQNLLEPAALGKAIVFGPHQENFSNEAAILLDEEGAVQVSDSNTLAVALRSLLDDGARRERLGMNARAAVEARRDMAERYYQALLSWCGSAFP